MATSPEQKEKNPLPEEGEQPETFPKLTDKMQCTCAGGAIISPISLPSATINLGDIVAAQAAALSAFTSAYSVVTVVIRMIGCIIDVICALTNPFALISAIIRLFGTCLPDFFLIFPQLTISAIVICVLKIIISIVEYILNTIIPIIADIIANIEDLIKAFQKDNADGYKAVAFKIVGLFQELQSILGIIATLASLYTMIKALLKLGLGPPCSGSCPSCSEDICPSIIKEGEISSNDGILSVIFGGEGPFDFKMKFSSNLQRENFNNIKDFFPKGIDYSELTTEDVAYTLNVQGNSYAATSVDSNGNLNLFQIPSEQLTDGYLSSVYNKDGVQTSLSDDNIRFGSNTDFFNPSFINKYIEIEELRTDDSERAQKNNGKWLVTSIYDSYNVLLERDQGEFGDWDGYNFLNPGNHIAWRMAPSVPSFAGIQSSYQVDINHVELIRHNLISLSCHPAVDASLQGTLNRFPDLTDELPELPNLDEVIENVNSCLSSVVPDDLNVQWVLDNYGSLADGVSEIENCVTGTLTKFKDDMLNYVQNTYSRILDLENSIFIASPSSQIIGSNIDILVTPIDRNGGKIAIGLPAETINVEISATEGTLTETFEVLDGYGAPTGDFAATLTSDSPITSDITATIDGKNISDFDGYDLQPRTIPVIFAEPSELARIKSSVGQGGIEPLGTRK